MHKPTHSTKADIFILLQSSSTNTIEDLVDPYPNKENEGINLMAKKSTLTCLNMNYCSGPFVIRSSVAKHIDIVKNFTFRNTYLYLERKPYYQPFKSRFETGRISAMKGSSQTLVKVVIFQLRGHGHLQNDTMLNYFPDSKSPL